MQELPGCDPLAPWYPELALRAMQDAETVMTKDVVARLNRRDTAIDCSRFSVAKPGDDAVADGFSHYFRPDFKVQINSNKADEVRLLCVGDEAVAGGCRQVLCFLPADSPAMAEAVRAIEFFVKDVVVTRGQELGMFDGLPPPSREAIETAFKSSILPARDEFPEALIMTVDQSGSSNGGQQGHSGNGGAGGESRSTFYQQTRDPEAPDVKVHSDSWLQVTPITASWDNSDCGLIIDAVAKVDGEVVTVIFTASQITFEAPEDRAWYRRDIDSSASGDDGRSTRSGRHGSLGDVARKRKNYAKMQQGTPLPSLRASDYTPGSRGLRQSLSPAASKKAAKLEKASLGRPCVAPSAKRVCAPAAKKTSAGTLRKTDRSKSSSPAPKRKKPHKAKSHQAAAASTWPSSSSPSFINIKPEAKRPLARALMPAKANAPPKSAWCPKVGATIQGNFNRRGVWYRCKVLQVSSSPATAAKATRVTYDVEYDDGSVDRCMRRKDLGPLTKHTMYWETNSFEYETSPSTYGNETPETIATALRISAGLIVIMNKYAMKGLTETTVFGEGLIRLPNNAQDRVHCAADDETPAMIGLRYGVSPSCIVKENIGRITTLRNNSKLKENCILFLPHEVEAAMKAFEEAKSAPPCGCATPIDEQVVCDGCDCDTKLCCLGLTAIPDQAYWFCERCHDWLGRRSAASEAGAKEAIESARNGFRVDLTKNRVTHEQYAISSLPHIEARFGAAMKAAATDIVADVRKRQLHDEQALRLLQVQCLDQVLLRDQQQAVQARHRRQAGGHPPLLVKVVPEVPFEHVDMLNTLEAAGYIEQQAGLTGGGDLAGHAQLHAVFLNQSAFSRSEQWASHHPLFDLMPQLVAFIGSTVMDEPPAAADGDLECDDLDQFVAEAVHLKTARLDAGGTGSTPLSSGLAIPSSMCEADRIARASAKPLTLRRHQQASLKWMRDRERCSDAAAAWMGGSGVERSLSEVASGNDEAGAPAKDNGQKAKGAGGVAGMAGAFWVALELDCGIKCHFSPRAGILTLVPPSDARGGILADGAGMGKSVTMLALIAEGNVANLSAPDDPIPAIPSAPVPVAILPRELLLEREWFEEGKAAELTRFGYVPTAHPDVTVGSADATNVRLSNATVIFAAGLLLPQWAAMLRRFTDLTVHNVVSSPRPWDTDQAHLMRVADVVLVPHSALERNSNQFSASTGAAAATSDSDIDDGTPLGAIMRTEWRRMVVDDSHTVKNRGCHVASKVRARYRWLLTHSPVAGSGGGAETLFGQLVMLNVSPFDDRNVWKALCSASEASHLPDQARFVRRIACELSVGHPRTVMVPDLPTVTTVTQRVAWSNAADRAVYDQCYGFAVAEFQRLEHQSPQTALKHARYLFSNAFAMARQACSHPGAVEWDKLCTTRRPSSTAAIVDPEVIKSPQMGPEEVAGHLVAYDEGCLVCLAPKDEMEEPTLIETCKHAFCNDCVRKLLGKANYNGQARGRCPKCRQIFKSSALLTLSPAHSGGGGGGIAAQRPSGAAKPRELAERDMADLNAKIDAAHAAPGRTAKLEALMTAITQMVTAKNNRLPRAGQRAAVFSHFAGTLREAKSMLAGAGISTCLITAVDSLPPDGSKNTATVVLVTHAAAAFGLDLGNASNVFLLEPVCSDRSLTDVTEQQALDCVYRIGQRQPVVVTTFVIEGTVEERLATLPVRPKGLTDRLESLRQLFGVPGVV